MKILKKTKILITVLVSVMMLVPLVAIASQADEATSVYTRFEGHATYVSDNYPYSNHVQVEGEDENVINFIITENTLFMTADGPATLGEINVGDKLVVYFIQPLVEAMIYPPHREASVFIIAEEDSHRSIFFGRLDEDLVSEDNSLRLNISDDTVILRANGEDGSDVRLEGRDLAVVYTIATRSIPAQTTPELIVILNPTPEMAKEMLAEYFGTGSEDGYIDFEVGGPLLLDQETIDRLNAQLQEDLGNAQIIVRGETVDAPETAVRGGIVFLPLRAIAEALGYDVYWEAETSSVALGAGVRLQIGSYEYTVGRMAPITLYSAPVLINGLTYVPMEFFGDVLGLDAWFMIEDGRAEIIIADRDWEIESVDEV